MGRIHAGVLCALSATAIFAQTQTATVRGVITDRSNAVVPGARVTLTNVDQNRPYGTITNNAGEYFLAQMSPSHYTLSVQAAGLKEYQQTGLTLEVAQLAVLDVMLEVGPSTEVVEVNAEAPLLETGDATLDAVVNSKSAEALPLNGRNILQLIALTPGINTTRSTNAQTALDYRRRLFASAQVIRFPCGCVR
jgi:Carboxypeptidase regulatory-like domain